MFLSAPEAVGVWMQQRSGPPSPVPFVSVEAAWFGVVQRLQPGPGTTPGWVSETARCLDTLYRRRRIDLLHGRILRIWGLRGVAPNPSRPRERSDWLIWREAMDRLEGPLRSRGIVAGGLLQETSD